MPPWCPTHRSLKLGLLGIWLMARPCSQELPAVKPSCLEAGDPREPDLHCRAQHPAPSPQPPALPSPGTLQSKHGSVLAWHLPPDQFSCGHARHWVQSPPTPTTTMGGQTMPAVSLRLPGLALLHLGKSFRVAPPLPCTFPISLQNQFAFASLFVPVAHAMEGLIHSSSIYCCCSLAKCLTLF